MKRRWTALMGSAAVAATIVAATLGASETTEGKGDSESGRPDAASISLIEFMETVPLGSDPSSAVNRKVQLFAEHRGDVVNRLRFLVTFDGQVAEERLWQADRSEFMAVRNWESCMSTDEPVPAPRPDSLKVILDEYFGPAAVPPEAKKLTDGTSRWETSTGMMRMAYTDLGGPYPDRIVEIKGPDGSVGSTINGTRLEKYPALPSWRADWPSCLPVASAP
ncbi:hypothetical protein ACFY9C_09855 [Streptomyces filamentosus]|uniref:hypothetical protein n=1 Tax=Streptomyces filamentosus TaxID=67294 RepID=UPI0036EBF57D